MNSLETPFLAGVVEGFYGQTWNWKERRGYADFLAEASLGCYLYAPKADSYLRKAWRETWPTKELQELEHTASLYRDRGLNFGIGLSPYNLYREYDASGKRDLQAKLKTIRGLQPGVIAILFDDMPGNFADLAQVQADIVRDIQDFCPQSRIMVCPTYYTFDPVLEQVFGKMPPDYWEHLGAALTSEVDVLWTGNQVCSTAISASDIDAISERLGRRPALWDNYPVNDSARACQFLYLDALRQRDPALQDMLTGHLCNPMNQPALSRFALASLAHIYRENYDADACREAQFTRLAGEELAALLRRDWSRFQTSGLAQISDADRSQLISEYSVLDDAAGREVSAWLQGHYAFDPECLTG